MPHKPLHRKLRKCANCGKEAYVCYTSCKVWDANKKRMVYCGMMRVVR